MIETAHCTCMAGLGESCSHIGAILWRLQLHKKTCTDEVCKWNQDFVKKTKPELIAKINFYSSKAVEKYKHKKQKTTVFPGTFVVPDDENIGTFLQKLSKLSSKVVALHSYSE